MGELCLLSPKNILVDARIVARPKKLRMPLSGANNNLVTLSATLMTATSASLNCLTHYAAQTMIVIDTDLVLCAIT